MFLVLTVDVIRPSQSPSVQYTFYCQSYESEDIPVMGIANLSLVTFALKVVELFFGVMIFYSQSCV